MCVVSFVGEGGGLGPKTQKPFPETTVLWFAGCQLLHLPNTSGVTVPCSRSMVMCVRRSRSHTDKTNHDNRPRRARERVLLLFFRSKCDCICFWTIIPSSIHLAMCQLPMRLVPPLLEPAFLDLSPTSGSGNGAGRPWGQSRHRLPCDLIIFSVAYLTLSRYPANADQLRIPHPGVLVFIDGSQFPAADYEF